MGRIDVLSKKTIAVAIAAGAVSTAVADRLIVEIAVGPPSSIDLELCQDLPIVGGCDSDMSSITGTARFFVDTNLGVARLVAATLTTTESLDYTYTGLLSQVDATASTVDIVYAGTGPTAPASVSPTGDFTFVAVDLNIVGTAAVTGTVLGAGDVNETIDFADFGPFASDLAGNLTETAGVWSLSGGVSFDETTTGDVLGLTVTTNAIGSLVIDGTGTGTPACAADCDFNGTLNLDDIDCFVSGFLSSDLVAVDCDGNGTLNLDDLDCFVASFLAGCP